MTADREIRAMEAALAALQPLKPDERRRVLEWLWAKLDFGAPPADSGPGGGPSVVRDGIKQFVKQKSPGDDVSRATTLAYFLEHARKLASYGYDELSQARVSAALPKFNLSRAVANAQRAGYLTTAGKHGMYQVTSTGEALVEAMPDTEAIKQVKAQGTKRRRKTSAGRPATKKK